MILTDFDNAVQIRLFVRLHFDLGARIDTGLMRRQVMSYTIVSDICEGVGDCVPVCPVECIHWADGKTNAKGTKYPWIDDATCIDCGACFSACPVEGAIP